MPAEDDRAHEKLCTVIYPGPPNQCTTFQFDELLQRLARQTSENPSQAPDCSSLIPDAPEPAMYLLWIIRVSTPGLFSLTCVGEHIRKQFVENGKVVMSIFNDTGGYGEEGQALGPGTCMVVFKMIQIEKLRFVPVSFSTRENNAIKEYVLRCQSLKDGES